MKRFTLILVLVILISLAVVTPVFAGGGDILTGRHNSSTTHPGRMYGVFGWGNGKGIPRALWYSMGDYQACFATPPKTPWWAGN